MTNKSIQIVKTIKRKLTPNIWPVVYIYAHTYDENCFYTTILKCIHFYKIVYKFIEELVNKNRKIFWLCSSCYSIAYQEGINVDWILK